MKKLLLAALAATASFAAAPSAQAAQFINITGPSGNFGDDEVTCTGGAAFCSFSRTFTFITPVGFNLASADISSIATSAATNIDFTSVTLNGVEFNTLSSGTQEFRNLLNQVLVSGGTNTLFVSGNAGVLGSTTAANASFAGNLSFAAAAVPEPAAWAMMILGMGMVGYAMRRRATVRFAAA